LLEVLIVVAILVILAGSASIALFRYLDDAKKGRAKADMMSIETALKALYMESGGTQWPDPSNTAPVAAKLEQGSNGLISPWGTPYTWTMAGQNQDGSETQRPIISCSTNKGEIISWPEMEKGR
jgi:type II secretory pathway pseudopilin PulG